MTSGSIVTFDAFQVPRQHIPVEDAIFDEQALSDAQELGARLGRQLLGDVVLRNCVAPVHLDGIDDRTTFGGARTCSDGERGEQGKREPK
jgi:hypothetical protein